MQVEQSYNTHARKLNSKGELLSAENEYIVFDAVDEEEALQAVYDDIQENGKITIGNAKLESVEIDNRENETTYRVKAIYSTGGGSSSNDDSDDGDEAEMSFDCGGGTRHITHGIKLKRNVTPSGLTSINPQTAIGWNGKYGAESEIAGVDVPCAQLRETYTKTMRKSRITTSFKRKVAGMVGKVNSSNFKGWDEGEVMFLGCSYSAPVKGSEKIKVTFNFAIQMNEKNVSYGGEDVGTVAGWDYIWAITRPDPQSKQAKVVGVYVTEVMKKANFKELGV